MTHVRLAGIDHVLVLVEGMERSQMFYERLGCVAESVLPKYGMLELNAGGSHLDLVDIGCPEGAWARPSVSGGRNVDHVAIAVEEPSAVDLRQYLDDAAIEIVEERAEGDKTSIYVRDPSGNAVELIART